MNILSPPPLAHRDISHSGSLVEQCIKQDLGCEDRLHGAPWWVTPYVDVKRALRSELQVWLIDTTALLSRKDGALGRRNERAIRHNDMEQIASRWHQLCPRGALDSPSLPCPHSNGRQPRHTKTDTEKTMDVIVPNNIKRVIFVLFIELHQEVLS